VLGTAGHIDHGKTALIRALTGVDTDRLPEEKARGITIVLGFAPLDLADGLRVSVVDVPGHEGLVRTMVAGATGIDLVLIVVAADEGVMPQTREHVAICQLLGITRGVVALTKVDLVSDDVLELAREEVSELLAPTALADVPILPVSSTTGAGLDALRAELARTIASAAPRTPRAGPPRLPVDRSFAARGFGCVVTGTLVGGAFAVGDRVEIQPSGRTGRVRGIQNHGVTAERGAPGVRCALNLQGIDVANVSRGDVVSTPGAIAPTRTVDVELVWLSVAPESRDPVHVEFLVGTSERRGRVAAIGTDPLVPGATQFARIHLDGAPVPILPGDRFIARGFARTAMGGQTLGGGVVLDAAPPHRRRSEVALVRDLEDLARRDAKTDLLVRIRRSGLSGIAAETLARETGLDRAARESALAEIAKSGDGVATPAGTWLGRDAVGDLESRLLGALASYHAEEPLRPGMPIGALRGRLPDNVPRDAVELAIARLVERDALRVEGEVARLPEHRPTLDAEGEALTRRLLAEASSAGLEPPSERDWAQRHSVDVDRLRDLLAHLARDGRLVRARDDLWFDRGAVDALRERVRVHLREHGRLSTQQYKELIGTTRRTAVPLMELFDAEHLTLRSGDARVLRGGDSN
jgi:selenocysteine-specific elongation factor